MKTPSVIRRSEQSGCNSLSLTGGDKNRNGKGRMVEVSGKLVLHHSMMGLHQKISVLDHIIMVLHRINPKLHHPAASPVTVKSLAMIRKILLFTCAAFFNVLHSIG